MKHSKLSEMCEEAITDPAKVRWFGVIRHGFVTWNQNGRTCLPFPLFGVRGHSRLRGQG